MLAIPFPSTSHISSIARLHTIERARKTIETERKQALDGVETQIAGLAMQAARKIVDEETRKQGNQAIYDQFLESVGDAHDGKDE